MLVQVCVFVLSRLLSQVVLHTTRPSSSESERSAQGSFAAVVAIVDQSLVVVLLQESVVVVARLSQVVLQATRPSVVAAVVALPKVVASQESIVVVPKWLLLLLSDPMWLLLLLPEDLLALVAEGSQVLVGFADTRLLAENDRVVWSPLVMIAAMAALGSS